MILLHKDNALIDLPHFEARGGGAIISAPCPSENKELSMIKFAVAELHARGTS